MEQTLASVQRSYQQDEPRLVGEVRKARFFCNAKKCALFIFLELLLNNLQETAEAKLEKFKQQAKAFFQLKTQLLA
ncbi:MAG: hypothetical protein IJZ71_08430 [Treponema sp.]|nr:hypothetical protein [Treponema sp.]